MEKVAIKNLLCTENQLPQADNWSSLKRKQVEEFQLPTKRQKTSTGENPSTVYPSDNGGKNKIRKRKEYWSEAQDKALKKAVENCKDGVSWVEVAEEMKAIRPGVTRDSCYKRYELMLDNRINRAPWTIKEYRKLLIIVQDYDLNGAPWKEIAERLGTNRTNQKCREIYFSLTTGTLQDIREEILKNPLDTVSVSEDSV